MREVSENPVKVSARYEIAGFRSLRDFSITLTPGINLIVGPNGSGKSNFIDLLDFLNTMFVRGATAAVSASGGVGRVFGIETAKQKLPKLVIRVESTANFFRRETLKENRSFMFDYKVEICFNRRDSFVFISKESLKIWPLVSFDKLNIGPVKPLGELRTTRKSTIKPDAVTFTVTNKIDQISNFESMSVNPLLIRRPYQSKLEGSIARYIDARSIEYDESFVSQGGGIEALNVVREAITRGRSFNISPTAVRNPDDISRQPFIDREGGGLTATLHHLQRLQNKTLNPRAGRYLPRADGDTLDAVVEWTKLVLPSIRKISTRQDPISGKYQGFLHLEGEKPLQLPLAAASDGTLKWLTLVCLIEAIGSAYSIEEPENFLHPTMQGALVQLIRDSLASSDADERFILSTHSETLISECKPQELIIFCYEDGQTKARRIQNTEQVLSEINSTGFGLGYYYARNAVS